MPLEAATFIQSLDATNPTSGDRKSQGDDHLRLIKSVLKSTFPNATSKFYFPTVVVLGANITLTTEHNNAILYLVTTTSFNINLPALTAGDAGWTVTMIKYTVDPNLVFVQPQAGGGINTSTGGPTFVAVGRVCQPTIFTWSGGAWFCLRDGPQIGTVETHFGATLPPGYLWCDGAGYAYGSFNELYTVLGRTTTPDLRGRVEAGRDDMGGVAANRLTNAYFGLPGTGLWNASGNEYRTLATANLPPYTPAGSVTIADPGHSHNYIDYYFGTVTGPVIPSGGSAGSVNTTRATDPATTGITASFAGTAQGGTSTPFTTVQPTAICNKIIRAC